MMDIFYCALGTLENASPSILTAEVAMWQFAAAMSHCKLAIDDDEERARRLFTIAFAAHGLAHDELNALAERRAMYPHHISRRPN